MRGLGTEVIEVVEERICLRSSSRAGRYKDVSFSYLGDIRTQTKKSHRPPSRNTEILNQYFPPKHNCVSSVIPQPHTCTSPGTKTNDPIQIFFVTLPHHIIIIQTLKHSSSHVGAVTPGKHHDSPPVVPQASPVHLEVACPPQTGELGEEARQEKESQSHSPWGRWRVRLPP